MAEYINREDVIDALYAKRQDITNIWCRTVITECVEEIQELPSADVQPVVHGRWLLNSDRIPVCSVCDGIALQKILLRFPTPEYYSKFVLSNYCPHCGAIIDGGDF